MLRYWNWSRGIFRPASSFFDAWKLTRAVYVNGRDVPDDELFVVASFCGFGYVRRYRKRGGQFVIDFAAGQAESYRQWGIISLRPRRGGTF